MAGSGKLWQIEHKGDQYLLSQGDLTAGVLRQFKQWFGPSYGKYLIFVQLLMEGDVDAWACALWLVLRNAGVKPLPAHPANLDFSVAELMSASQDETADEEEDPTPASADETTPAYPLT